MNEQHRIRVLFVVPSLKRAGAETQVVKLVNGLSGERFSIHLFTFQPYMDQLNDLDRTKVNFHHVPKEKKLQVSIVSGITDIIAKYKIEIVHATNQYSMLYAWLGILKSRLAPRLITAIHTTVSRDRKEELLNRLIYRWILRRCDRVLFVCKNQAEYWIEKYRFLRQISVVIHNGVSTDWFDATKFVSSGHALRQEFDISSDAFVVSCIAGFRREKGQVHLIRAVSGIDRPIYIIFAGDGYYREQIEREISKAGIGKYIRILGVVDDVRPVLAASDMSILPSTAVETFSMAMLESLSMGAPVIGSDIAGMSEAVIPGVTGELFTPGNVTELRAALEKYVDNRAILKKMGIRGRELIKEKYYEELMVDKTAQLLQAII